MHWMVLPLRRYADFSGRSTRREYWLFRLFVYGSILVSVMIAGAATGNLVESGTSATLIAFCFILWVLVLLLPSIAVAVRRLHDQNRSGFFYILCFVPVIGWILWLVLMLIPGTKGRNDYGEDPRDPAFASIGAIFD